MNIEGMKYEIAQTKEKAIEEGRFTIFDTNLAKTTFKKCKNNKDNFETFYNVFAAWDLKFNMPAEVGAMLEDLLKDSNNVIGFHRTSVSNEDLKDIMENGLINYGHINAVGGTAITKMPYPSLTLSPLTGMAGYYNLVSSYHENDSTILFKLPRSVVDEELHLKNDADPSIIYDLSDSNPRFKPELAIGVIKKRENGLDEYISRDDILNQRKR